MLGKSNYKEIFTQLNIFFPFRTIPLGSINITSVLMTYNIEIINAINITFCIPTLFVYAISTMPYILAQAIAFIYFYLVSIPPALGIAISCFQILYVTNFSALFTWSPEKIGKLTFLIITVFCVIPYIIIIFVSVRNGEHAAQIVAFFTGKHYKSIGLYKGVLPIVCLVVICIVMLSLSFILIWNHNRSRNSSSQDNICSYAKSLFSVKRLLFLMFAFGFAIAVLMIIKRKEDKIKVPSQVHTMTFILNFTLLLFIKEKDVLSYTKRKLARFVGLRDTFTTMPSSDSQTAERGLETPQTLLADLRDPSLILAVGRELEVPGYERAHVFPAVQC